MRLKHRNDWPLKALKYTVFTINDSIKYLKAQKKSDETK